MVIVVVVVGVVVGIVMVVGAFATVIVAMASSEPTKPLPNRATLASSFQLVRRT